MIFKKNKKKNKKPLTSQQKEQRFIKIGTRICIIIVFILAIVFGISDTVDMVKDVPSVITNENLAKLASGVNRSQLIYAEIDHDLYYDELIAKINNSELDILMNNKPSYNKYSQNNIAINSDLILNNQEIALLYSHIFMFNPDEYDVIFQQLLLSTTDNGYTIDIVSTIDFYKLFTSKAKGQYDTETLNLLPKKVFITNTAVIENNEAQYLNVKYNNLTEAESLAITELISSVNEINLNEYPIKLFTDFINNLSAKTNTNVSYVDNCFEFCIKV